jgi:ankyrin repeat protein
LDPLDRAALAADPRNDNAQSFPSIARQLLEHGSGLTLHAAVALGDAPRVRELVEADPSALHRIGRDGGLLTLAVNHGQIEMVRLLLDLGADVDERILLEELEEPTQSWGMPLWYAALANQRDIAELLLARGAKPQPYMIAGAHDEAEAARLLEADTSEDLAQELAWSAADHGCPAIIALALARLKWRSNDPKWHWVLIQPIRGASGDSSTNEGHFASMRVLLEHGIDPDVSRFGQTTLHFAAGYHGPVSDADRARFAALLLDHGARLDLRDDLLKSTPLGWACRWGRKELADLLIARGAPINEPDAEPWATPLAWARKMRQDAILAALSGNLADL